MSAARDAVLAAVRAARPPAVPHPGTFVGPAAADLRLAFATSLEAAGGSCRRVAAGTPLEAALGEVAGYAAARRVLAAVAGVARAEVGWAAGADLDVAILPGRLGVAESGAVWVDLDALPHRAAPFLAEHLVLVLSERDLVSDLHQAYARLGLGAAGCGCFVAGPSKTADIEQALVVGAHGPRTTTVLLLAGPPAADAPAAPSA